MPTVESGAVPAPGSIRHAPSHTPADRRATAEAGSDTVGKAQSPWDAIINEYLGGSSGSRRLTTPI